MPGSNVTLPSSVTLPVVVLPSSVVTVTVVPASGLSPVEGVTVIIGFSHFSGVGSTGGVIGGVTTGGFGGSVGLSFANVTATSQSLFAETFISP